MKFKLVPCLVICLLAANLNAQNLLPLKKKDILSPLLVPAILVGTGVFAIDDNDILSRLEIREERNEHFPAFRVHTDDYLQFAPIALALGMKGIGVKGRNDWRNSLSLLVKSEILVGVLVYTGKKLTAVPRPDTGTLNSFPSGHTAEAFMAATYLHKEFGSGRPWVSIIAYSFASGVGILRVMNDRHWASDVLAGAGIGLLSTNLIYLTHRTKKNVRHFKTQISYIPKGMMVNLNISF